MATGHDAGVASCARGRLDVGAVAGEAQVWQAADAQWVMPLHPCMQQSLYGEAALATACPTKVRQPNSTTRTANNLCTVR